MAIKGTKNSVNIKSAWEVFGTVLFCIYIISYLYSAPYLFPTPFPYVKWNFSSGWKLVQIFDQQRGQKLFISKKFCPLRFLRQQVIKKYLNLLFFHYVIIAKLVSCSNQKQQIVLHRYRLQTSKQISLDDVNYENMHTK